MAKAEWHSGAETKAIMKQFHNDTMNRPNDRNYTQSRQHDIVVGTAAGAADGAAKAGKSVGSKIVNWARHL